MTGRQSVRSGTFKVPLPCEGPRGWHRGSTRSPSCSPMRGTRRRYSASGIAVIPRAGCPPIRASTSGGATATAPTRRAGRPTRRSRRSPRRKGFRRPRSGRGRRATGKQRVRELNLEVRPFLDELIVGQATDYITRQAAGNKPFFTYIALSHMHPKPGPSVAVKVAATGSSSLRNLWASFEVSSRVVLLAAHSRTSFQAAGVL